MAADANSQAPYKLSEAYEFLPTIEEVVRECNAAWNEAQVFLKEGVRNDVHIYEQLVDMHSDLNKTYPVILAAMSVGDYSEKAVRKFFKYVQNHPIHNESEYIDVQSAYSAILLRETHKHANTRDITETREHVRQELESNKKKLKEIMDSSTEYAKELNVIRARSRAAELRERLPHDAAIILNGETRPIQVKFDD
jgi:hypothetical protein